MECRAGDIIRDEVVGKGTSAEVYKLILSSGQTLAIKRCEYSCNLIAEHGLGVSAYTPDGGGRVGMQVRAVGEEVYQIFHR